VRVEQDQAFKPYPAPERELPRTWHGRRPWWHVAGITLAIVLWVAGVALVAFVVLMMVLFAQVGSNK
jgi:hypothetical protein